MAYLAERNNNEESDWRKRVIRLYKDSELKGEKREFSYAVDGGQIDLEEEQFNNTISSVVLPRGVCVEFSKTARAPGARRKGLRVHRRGHQELRQRRHVQLPDHQRGHERAG